MWNSKKTLYNRRNGDMKEALHVLCRKSMLKDAILVSLELFESKSGSAVMEKLRLIAIMEKYPTGAQYIPWFNKTISSWRSYRYHEQRNMIIRAVSSLCKIPTNRHIPYLARVAEEESDTLETKLAYKIHYYLVRHQKKNDYPTPSDFRKKTILKTLQKSIFDDNGTPVQKAIWNYFVLNMDTKPHAHYFIYTLVALKFHEAEFLPSLEPKNQSNVVTDRAILPDEVYNMNTKEGKEKKRGMKHLLETMTSNKSTLKRKAHELMLKDEKTKHSRKKLRIQFLEFGHFKQEKVVFSKMIKVPHGKTPGIWEIHTDEEYIVKGPYTKKNELDFQLLKDEEKKNYGLKQANYEVVKHSKFYWLTCPKYEGKPIKQSKTYTDLQWHSIIKILVFRGVKGCSETSLNNIIELDSGEFLSINEIKQGNRSSHLMDFFFTKKPSSVFQEQLKTYILENKESVDFIFKQYRQSLFNFNLNL